MTFGTDYIQTAIYKKKPWKPLLYYIKPMTVCLQVLTKQQHALVLGMGGGALLHYLRYYYPQLQITAVEISAIIIQLAHEYFQLSKILSEPALSIVNNSAENFVMTTQQRFNTIFIDIYQPTHYPASCATIDFFEHCSQLLNTPGVLTVNAVFENGADFVYLLNAIHTGITKQTLCMLVPKTTNIIIHAYKGDNFLDFIQQLQQRKLISKLEWNVYFGLMAY